MSIIRADYGEMSAGEEGLVATWGRIESHLAELQSAVAATADMQAETLVAFDARKASWDAAAAERQSVLRALAAAVGSARDFYRQVDRKLSAQFAP